MKGNPYDHSAEETETDGGIEGDREVDRKPNRETEIGVSSGVRFEDGTVVVEEEARCNTSLVPRVSEHLDWSVRLEEGAVYYPPETGPENTGNGSGAADGIYARDLECGPGVGVRGDVYARNLARFEPGKANQIGTRVMGSVMSDEKVHVTSNNSNDDYPVVIYGDVISDEVVFDGPVVVYGNVKARTELRTSDHSGAVVTGVVDAGAVEADRLLAFSVSADGDVEMGTQTAVVNPRILSRGGEVNIERVRVIEPESDDLLESALDGNLFDDEAGFDEAESLHPSDVKEVDGVQYTSRAWRTVKEDRSRHEDIRSFFEKNVIEYRKNTPRFDELGEAPMTGQVRDPNGSRDAVPKFEKVRTESRGEVEVGDEEVGVGDEEVEVGDEEVEVGDEEERKARAEEGTQARVEYPEELREGEAGSGPDIRDIMKEDDMEFMRTEEEEDEVEGTDDDDTQDSNPPTKQHLEELKSIISPDTDAEDDNGSDTESKVDNDVDNESGADTQEDEEK